MSVIRALLAVALLCLPLPVSAAEPVVAVWYRGAPAGTPRQDDLAVIRALGFNGVVWPDFSLAEGLAGATPRPRGAVIAEIARTLGEIAGTCQSFDRMLVQVGWIPAELPDPSDAAGPAGRYAPGLRVIVAPPEQPEDAAAPGDFVQSFLVPLVADGGEG